MMPKHQKGAASIRSFFCALGLCMLFSWVLGDVSGCGFVTAYRQTLALSAEALAWCCHLRLAHLGSLT